MHAFVVSKSSLLPNGMSSKHLCAHSAACKGTCRLNFCNGSNLWRRFMLCTPDIFLRWSVALRRGMPGYYNPSAYSDYYHNHYYNNPNYPPFPNNGITILSPARSAICGLVHYVHQPTFQLHRHHSVSRIHRRRTTFIHISRLRHPS